MMDDYAINAVTGETMYRVECDYITESQYLRLLDQVNEIVTGWPTTNSDSETGLRSFCYVDSDGDKQWYTEEEFRDLVMYHLHKTNEEIHRKPSVQWSKDGF